MLPGIGGGFARAGFVEALYLGELVGLILIWAGYRKIVRDGRSASIHPVQQSMADRALARQAARARGSVTQA